MKRSMNLAEALEVVRQHGRGKDTEVAHVMPREKALLKALGGRGSTNPKTGLREYEVDGGGDGGGTDAGGTDAGGGEGGQTDGMGDFGSADERSAGPSDFGGQLGGYMESASASAPAPVELSQDSSQGGSIASAPLGPPTSLYGDFINTPVVQEERNALDRLDAPAAVPTVGDFELATGIAAPAPAPDIRDFEQSIAAGLPTPAPQPSYLDQVLSALNTGPGIAGAIAGTPTGLLAQAMENINNTYFGGQARAFGGTEEAGPFQASLGPEGLNESVAPAATSGEPAPAYIRPAAQEVPDFLSGYLSPGLTDLQRRALISTLGSQGVNPLFRSRPVQQFYASMLARELVNPQNQLAQTPYILPIEQRYLSGVVGVPGAQPQQIYQGIRPLLS